MKRLVLGIVLLSTLCFGMDSIQMDSLGSSSNSYQGDSGRNYQYDLSNQNDRQEYSTDTDAQIRDNSADGYVDKYYDNSQGQYGGGIYDN